MTALVAAAGDPHTNSTYGLSIAQVELDNGAYYQASPSQKAILKAWTQFWEIVKHKKEQLGAECYAVIDGDLVDDNSHDSCDPITRNRSVIIDHACTLMLPVREVADYLFIVRGTEAHTGGHGEMEETIAKELGAQRNTLTNRSSWWFLPLEVEGVLWDVAHHTNTFSRRPWTVDAAAERQSAILRAEYLERGERVPNMAIRAHNHKWTLSNGRLPPWTFMLPPFCLTNAFGYRLGAGANPEPVGGCWWVVEDGEIADWDVERWEPKRVPTWRKP